MQRLEVAFAPLPSVLTLRVCMHAVPPLFPACRFDVTMANDQFPWVWFILCVIIASIWYVLKDVSPTIKNALPYLNALMVGGLAVSTVIDFSDLGRGIKQRFWGGVATAATAAAEKVAVVAVEKATPTLG